jgi:hypothetical protein
MALWQGVVLEIAVPKVLQFGIVELSDSGGEPVKHLPVTRVKLAFLIELGPHP